MKNKIDILDAIFMIIIMFNVKQENWNEQIKKYKLIKSKCLKGE